jgi:protein-S-isoprenylcysteine O-methyltransferase Ste14
MEPFATHDAVAHALLTSALLAWVGLELVVRLRNRGAKRPSDWTLFVLTGSVGGAVWIAYRADDVQRTVLGGGWAPFTIGFAMLVLGIVFRFWAIVTLGRFFTGQVAIQPGHRVVRSGPYRYVRHPSYTGGLVALIGLGIALDDWLSIAVMALLPLAGLVVRIRHEEAVLTAAFGDEYRSYAAHTRRLVPRVW